MQQIAIKIALWSEPRFTLLQKLTGWSAPEALGVLTMLWANTRVAEASAELSRDALRHALSHAKGDLDSCICSLQEAGYVTLVEASDNLFCVVDNQKHFAVRAKLRDAGARGGYHQHRARKPKKLAVAKGSKKEPSQVSAAFAAYSEAYLERYGVKPVSNRTVNGQLARLVEMVGADLPALARFYVQHNNSFYLRCQHSIGVLLKDYSGLYTQMHRNVSVTEHDVTAHSDSFRLDAQLRRLGVH